MYAIFTYMTGWSLGQMLIATSIEHVWLVERTTCRRPQTVVAIMYMCTNILDFVPPSISGKESWRLNQDCVQHIMRISVRTNLLMQKNWKLWKLSMHHKTMPQTMIGFQEDKGWNHLNHFQHSIKTKSANGRNLRICVQWIWKANINFDLLRCSRNHQSNLIIKKVGMKQHVSPKK